MRKKIAFVIKYHSMVSTESWEDHGSKTHYLRTDWI